MYCIGKKMVDSRNARRGCQNDDENGDNDIDIYKVQYKGVITSEYYECLDDMRVKTSSDRQRYFLEIAAKIAMKSPMGHKHGAIIVYKGKIIGTGHNYYFAHFSIHAEVSALSCIKKRYKHLLSDCELYVVRIGPDKYNNPLKYSKPCCNCQNAILKHNIKRAFYSTNYDYDMMRNTMCIAQ